MSYWPVPANQSYMQGAAPMPAGAVYMTAQGQQLYTQGAGPLYTGPVVMNGFPAPAAANMPTNAPPSGPYPPFSHPSGHGVMSTVHPTTTLNHQHNHYAPSQQAYGHPMASAMAPPAAPAIAIPEGLQMAPHTFHYWQLLPSHQMVPSASFNSTINYVRILRAVAFRDAMQVSIASLNYNHPNHIRPSARECATVFHAFLGEAEADLRYLYDEAQVRGWVR